MDNRTFGLTLLVVGMGGTMLTLYLLTLLLKALTHFLPVKPEKPAEAKGGNHHA